MSTNTLDHKLTTQRLIKAPPERVFAAWTTPEEILKWFGPATCRALSAQVDLRVGGEYRIRAHTESYGEMEVFGVYREVEIPSRLVYTWQWKERAAGDIGETLVTVEFVAVEGGTEVRLTHEGFPATEPRDNHNQGWNGCLDKLERQFEPSATGGCMPVGEFSWNELLTQDVAGSSAFYTKLFGWQTEKFGPTGDYTLLKSGPSQVGGMMKCPMPEVPTHWLAYVTVADCDASAGRAQELGAQIKLPPMDVPTVGRIAVLQDPQGAVFGVFQPARK